MKKLILLLSCINFIGCINDIDNRFDKKNTIHFTTFKEILKETWLLDAHKTNNQNYSLFPADSINEISLSILKKHHTSPEKFYNTITYYSQEPELIDSLLKTIREELEETYLSLPHEDDSDIEELNKSELITILRQCPFYTYKPKETKILMNTDLRDSLFLYFRRNPEKLGHATLRTLSNKLNELIKESKSK